MAKRYTKTDDRQDIYTRVTNVIVEQLEHGARPWVQPWSTGKHVAGPISIPKRVTGEPYRGINVLMLWLTAHERRYISPLWMTYNQAGELGGQVRKGEKGTTVVYASTFSPKDENGETDDEKRVPFMKGYTVFNVEQIDGLPAKFTDRHPAFENTDERDAAAEAFFANTGAAISHGGDMACFSPALDAIRMPAFAHFTNSGSYYATLAHEMTHWTGHKSRLDRNLANRFGDEAYAVEELVAELGAAFVGAILGIEPQVEEGHAGYIENWLKVLKSDKRAIFTAASAAQKAVDLLCGMQESEQAAIAA